MNLALGDEVYVVRSFGAELEPPIRGRIVTVTTGRMKSLLCYGVQAEDGSLYKAAESWLVPLMIVINEPVSLLD